MYLHSHDIIIAIVIIIVNIIVVGSSMYRHIPSDKPIYIHMRNVSMFIYKCIIHIVYSIHLYAYIYYVSTYL